MLPGQHNQFDLLDQPERSVSDEEGEGEEDDAGDDHHPGEHPEGQLAPHQDSIEIPEQQVIVRLKVKTVYPMFGVRAYVEAREPRQRTVAISEM